ncbi:MAG TPA: TIGR03009 domain-containing protein [Pirellulales bacterium]|nr:TIGR03009 domain-containing protein [Pirellulales bacterium]
MSSFRRRFVAKSAACLIASLACTAAVRGQEARRAQDPPRRASAGAARPPARDPNDGSVYASKKQAPQRVASGARPALGGKLNQFVPQVRRPQASWGQLPPEEEAKLELVLQAWEKKSSQVKTLQCEFQMWNYMVALNNNPNQPSRVCRGVILYAAPDKGHYHVREEARDPTAKEPQFVKKEGEHWVCDGNAVYEFNQQEKKLIERRLPKELRGKAISNSPLPFVFGTTAEQMLQRYWLRVSTPQELAGREIWLRIEPKFAEDRANYQRATVVLNEKQMLPTALGLELPNGDRTNYVFDKPSINEHLKKFFGWFDVPATPSGWKRIIEDPPTPEGPPAEGDMQTLRLKSPTKRK